MPFGLIDEIGRVCVRRDLCGDFDRMKVHCFGMAPGHNEGGALAVPLTHRPVDSGLCRSLVFRSARVRTALGPAARHFVLLSDSSLVGEPDLYGVELDAFFAPNLRQALGRAF